MDHFDINKKLNIKFACTIKKYLLTGNTLETYFFFFVTLINIDAVLYWSGGGNVFGALKEGGPSNSLYYHENYHYVNCLLSRDYLAHHHYPLLHQSL